MEDKITLSESEKLHNDLLEIAKVIEFNLEDGIDGREFIDVFFRLYEKSKTDKFYWQYCSSEAYKATYTKRKDDYIKKYDESTEADFCIEELDSIKDNYIEMHYPVIDVLDEDYSKFGTILKTTWVKGFVFNFKIFSDNQITSMIPLSFFDNDKQLQILQKRKTEFLNDKLISAKNEKITDDGEQKPNNILENNSKDAESINPYPRIFPNGKCWLLFEHWRNEVKERTQLAEFSFIYWQMQKDGLIEENIKPTEFRNWLYKNFNINLDDLKQLSNCNGGNKYQRYQTAKLLFQC